MAEHKRDRTRASRFRKTIQTGGRLRPENAEWLRQYETRQTIRNAKASAPPDAPQPLALPPGETETPPAGVPVHETEHITDRVEPTQFLWEPTVPPAPEGAEPPPPGAPQPPPPGAPIVDEAPPAAAAGADNVTAGQFAGFVCFLLEIGIQSGLELAKDLPIPPMYLAFATSPKIRGQAFEVVGGAAHRVAVKYGFTSIPMADEATVAIAVGGSIAATYFAMQKGAKQASAAAPAEAKDKEPEPEQRAQQKAPPDNEVVASALAVLRKAGVA